MIKAILAALLAATFMNPPRSIGIAQAVHGTTQQEIVVTNHNYNAVTCYVSNDATSGLVNYSLDGYDPSTDTYRTYASSVSLGTGLIGCITIAMEGAVVDGPAFCVGHSDVEAALPKQFRFTAVGQDAAGDFSMTCDFAP